MQSQAKKKKEDGKEVKESKRERDKAPDLLKTLAIVRVCHAKVASLPDSDVDCACAGGGEWLPDAD